MPNARQNSSSKGGSAQPHPNTQSPPKPNNGLRMPSSPKCAFYTSPVQFGCDLTSRKTREYQHNRTRALGKLLSFLSIAGARWSAGFTQNHLPRPYQPLLTTSMIVIMMIKRLVLSTAHPPGWQAARTVEGSDLKLIRSRVRPPHAELRFIDPFDLVVDRFDLVQHGRPQAQTVVRTARAST